MQLLYIFQCVHPLPLLVTNGHQVFLTLALRESDCLQFNIPFKSNENGTCGERDVLGGFPNKA